MTNYEAISAAIYPYDVDENLIQKSCIDLDLDPDVAYQRSSKPNVAKASISVLRNLISLSNESNGGYSLSYDANKLKERIYNIAKENGLADIAEEFEQKPQIEFLDWEW